jgi:hypothetical protein
VAWLARRLTKIVIRPSIELTRVPARRWLAAFQGRPPAAPAPPRCLARAVAAGSEVVDDLPALFELLDQESGGVVIIPSLLIKVAVVDGALQV